MILLTLLSCDLDRVCAGDDPTCVDADDDGVRAGPDCNDLDPKIYPGAPDSSGDGIDQDCLGSDLPGALRVHTLSDSTWEGTQPFGRAGDYLAAADFDGDGVDELVVSSISRQLCDFGPPSDACTGDAFVAVLSWSAPGWQTVATLHGSGAGWLTHIEAAPLIGDLDGDGLSDIVLAGDRYDSSSALFEREVVWYRGPLDANSEPERVWAANWGSVTLVPQADDVGVTAIAAQVSNGADWYLHRDAGVVSDLFSDPDLLLTSGGELTAAGAVLGPDDPVWVVVRSNNPRSVVPVASGLQGELALGDAGDAVLTGAGFDPLTMTALDLDGLAGDEIVVGRSITPDTDYAGEAHAFAVTGAGGATLASGTGELPADYFGDAFAALDLDGDGVHELIVGARGGGVSAGKGTTLRPGKVHVFQGPVTSLAPADAIATWTGTLPGEGLGASLVVGDFDGSGALDLAIGAPAADTDAGKAAGRVYVLFDPEL